MHFGCYCTFHVLLQMLGKKLRICCIMDYRYGNLPINKYAKLNTAANCTICFQKESFIIICTWLQRDLFGYIDTYIFLRIIHCKLRIFQNILHLEIMMKILTLHANVCSYFYALYLSKLSV